jgi:4-amino-4-deoxy-L-arabinose transferase-like glycosyltransferase
MGGYSIYITDEARNAQCAYEMYERGDWIVPTFNDELRTDKPPLHYWFMMLSYSIFGKTAFAARLFSAITGAFLIIFSFLFARKFTDERTANWTAIILLSSLGFITQFHLAVPDPYLILCISGAHFGYYLFDQSNNRKFLWLAYVSVGFGVLAKGPVAIVLPGMSIFFYMLLMGKMTWKNILELKPLAGILIVLLISVPWYVLVHIKTDGAWTQGFFLDHNVDRFSSPKEGHGGSFLLPTVFAFVTLLPFGTFLPQGIVAAVRNRKQNPVYLFSLIIVIVTILFFSVASTKLPSYISPIFPFAALMIGSRLAAVTEMKRYSFRISSLLFAILGVAIWFAVYRFLPGEKGFSSLTDLHLYFVPLGILGIVLIVISFFVKRAVILLIMSFAFIITHQLFYYKAFPEVDRINPVQQTKSLLQNETHIVAYKRFNQGYPWVLDRSIENLHDLSLIREKIKNDPNVIVISRKKYLDELSNLPLKEIAREVDILDNTTTVILEVNQ